MEKSNNVTGIINTTVQTVFLVLKLTKVVNWSWLWVLSPTWISTLIVLAILAYIKIRY